MVAYRGSVSILSGCGGFGCAASFVIFQDQWNGNDGSQQDVCHDNAQAPFDGTAGNWLFHGDHLQAIGIPIRQFIFRKAQKSSDTAAKEITRHKHLLMKKNQ